MQTVLDFFVGFLQKTTFNEYLEFIYAVILCVCLLKGEITLSRFVQSFSNMETRYKLNLASGKVTEDPNGPVDCQAEIESHQEETLSSFMDKYLPEIAMRRDIADLDESDFDYIGELCANNRIERYTKAIEGLKEIRSDLKIPDGISDLDLVDYIKSYKIGGDQSESTQDEPQSEQA